MNVVIIMLRTGQTKNRVTYLCCGASHSSPVSSSSGGKCIVIIIILELDLARACAAAVPSCLIIRSTRFRFSSLRMGKERTHVMIRKGDMRCEITCLYHACDTIEM